MVCDKAWKRSIRLKDCNKWCNVPLTHKCFLVFFSYHGLPTTTMNHHLISNYKSLFSFSQVLVFLILSMTFKNLKEVLHKNFGLGNYIKLCEWLNDVKYFIMCHSYISLSILNDFWILFLKNWHFCYHEYV